MYHLCLSNISRFLAGAAWKMHTTLKPGEGGSVKTQHRVMWRVTDGAEGATERSVDLADGIVQDFLACAPDATAA